MPRVYNRKRCGADVVLDYWWRMHFDNFLTNRSTALEKLMCMQLQTNCEIPHKQNYSYLHLTNKKSIVVSRLDLAACKNR